MEWGVCHCHDRIECVLLHIIPGGAVGVCTEEKSEINDTSFVFCPEVLVHACLLDIKGAGNGFAQKVKGLSGINSVHDQCSWLSTNGLVFVKNLVAERWDGVVGKCCEGLARISVDCQGWIFCLKSLETGEVGKSCS